MEWRDDGIIIGSRRHGETSLIIELMTPEHGRHLGLVRGGRSRKMAALLQPGNRVACVWRARLDEHLGMMAVEAIDLNAAHLMESAFALAGFQLAAAHLRLLPERDPHPGLFAALETLLEHLDTPAIAGPLMVRFELAVLDKLGFGLDLSRCAGTGVTTDLAYVSPKSGQAVSRAAGAPWADKMLPLPAFLTAREGRSCTAVELADAFRMTGFFFARDVWQPRGIDMPVSREAFMVSATRLMDDLPA